MRRRERLVVAAVLAIGLWQIAAGSWLPLKAWAAQNLLREAWERTRTGERDVRPWPWADTAPVARLRAIGGMVDLIILSGGSGRTLAFGPGHLQASAAPGAPGNIVLVGQQRYTLDEWSWEIPMGGCGGEDLLEAAQRELREETGLCAGRWKEVMRLHTSNSITDEIGIVFLAEDLTSGPTAFDETEKLEIRRLPLAEAVGMVLDGSITDAISAAGLLRVWLSRYPPALP